MTEKENDYGIDNPEGFGIQTMDAPGEPDRSKQATVAPVPDTAKRTRDEREGNRSGEHDTSEGTGHESGGGRGGKSRR